MNPTKIEWCHIFGPGSGFTWNPITGCTANCKDNDGQPYCYARQLAEGRLAHLYPNGFAPTFWPERLEQPLKRKQPSGIFVCSMGEIFDPHVPQEWRDQVWDVVRQCPQHIFFALTKRPDLMWHRDLLWSGNLWFGTSFEGHLGSWRTISLGGITRGFGQHPPWVVRFISFEPLLGHYSQTMPHWCNWVIIGQDSRPGQPRPQVEWVQGIIEQAQELGIPVFMKPPLADWWENEGHGERLQQWPEIQ